MKKLDITTQKKALIIIGIIISGLLISPKWMLAIAPWIHYSLLLLYFRTSNWKGFLLAVPILSLTAVIAQYEVFPMPVGALLTTMFVINILGLLPFILDRLITKGLPAVVSVFSFPIILTLFHYLLDQGPQGTWSNTAYTQYKFSSLIQVASITGIYGINFLIYFFASTLYHFLSVRKFQPALLVMPLIFVLSNIYGLIKLNQKSESKGVVNAAAITIDNRPLYEKVHEVVSGEAITLPQDLSQADPIVQDCNLSFQEFITNSELPKYQAIYEAMDESLEIYVNATRLAAERGAKMVLWSEAAIINTKSRECAYQDQVTQLADELDIYLFFSTAVFHPEKVGKEKRFIENKVLTFSPTGDLLNTYFKNIPVMGVEPSFKGDGEIPVIATDFGNLSPIICYDADHPKLVSQVSRKSTNTLVVPTGDWKAISPYHTYIAAVRCIENGVSMVKSASNGLSAMIDDRGRILAGYDFFDEEEVKLLQYDMPLMSSDTLYYISSKLFINLLTLGFAFLSIFKIIVAIRQK